LIVASGTKARVRSYQYIQSMEACDMEINPGDAVVEPLGSGHVLGPMMIWPPANGLADNARVSLSSAAHVLEEASEAICLPDLSSENPFA
jgi:hypothetical protein